MTRVMLVEDHDPFRQAIALILNREPGIEVVAQAGTLEGARRLLAEQDVDVAVVDLRLPDGDGNDLIREFKEGNPRASVLVLSMSPGEAEEVGADEVLAKDSLFEEIVGTIRRLGNG